MACSGGVADAVVTRSLEPNLVAFRRSGSLVPDAETDLIKMDPSCVLWTNASQPIQRRG